MPKGYWVGRVDVIKPEGYQAYGVALAEVLRKYGAKFLVRGGTFEAVEGKARGRNIVLEFKDHATALACYRSPDYQAAAALRRPDIPESLRGPLAGVGDDTMSVPSFSS